MKIFGLFVLMLSYSSVLGQVNLKEIDINIDEISCFGFNPSFNSNCDTTNYYLLLENYFEKDTVTVFCNDSLVFKETVSSNNSLGFAKKIKLGSVTDVENFAIKIGNNPKVKCSSLPGNYYIRIGYSYGEDILEICYSKLMPFYY